MTSDQIFPTFCHINDYDELGFKNLHRMLASSYPLNLWAPSSVLIKRELGPISSQQFLKYVDTGLIRVAGRSEWIQNSSGKRNGRGWEGAAWNKQIDGQLHQWALEDQRQEDPKQRRVLICGEETGDLDANNYLETHEGEAKRIARLARSKNAPRKIPAGTLQSALREAERANTKGSMYDFVLASRILRDAFNHGRAFRDMNARTPFLLTPSDRLFLEIIDDPDPLFNSHTKAAAPKRRMQVALEIQSVLATLDDLNAPGTSAQALAKFFGSEQHIALAKWSGRLMDHASKSGPVKGLHKPRVNLLESLEDGTFRQTKVKNAIDAGELGTDLAGIMIGGAGVASIVLGALGVAVGALTVSRAGLRQLGYASREFDGPNWPFLYLGRKRNKKNLRELIEALRQDHQP